MSAYVGSSKNLKDLKAGECEKNRTAKFWRNEGLSWVLKRPDQVQSMVFKNIFRSDFVPKMAVNKCFFPNKSPKLSN